jgi:hypothetical protein
VQDTKGNFLTATYTEDSTNGDYSPVRIDLGNAVSGINPIGTVGFVYESRQDVISTYTAGSLMRATKRLAKVQTYVGTTGASAALVKEYLLGYSQGGAAQRSRLSSVKECDASGACFPQANFTWTTFNLGFHITAHGLDNGAFGEPSWSSQNIAPRSLVDINGDGRADIFGFHSSGLVAATSTGTGSFVFAPTSLPAGAFGYGNGWQDNNVEPRFLADVNGDGLPDIVAFHASGVIVALNTGNGFTFAPPNGLGAGAFGQPTWASQATDPRYLVDMNGDGLADIVGFHNSGVVIALGMGNGNFAFGPTTGLSPGAFGYGNGWQDNNVEPRFLADVHGDGLPDIVAFHASGVIVALNTGNGFTFAPPNGLGAGAFGQPTWASQATDPRYLVDINGDGLADIVGFHNSGVVIALSMGNGNFAFGPTTGLSPGAFGYGNGWQDNNVEPRFLADVNGDGLPDIVGLHNSGVVIALNTGNGFAIVPSGLPEGAYGFQGPWQDQGVHPRFVTDVNGDGFSDIVGIYNYGPVPALNNATVRPDLLAAVMDSLGKTVSLTYQSIANTSNYVKDATSAYPTLDVQAPLYVVSSVSSSNGIGGTVQTDYFYTGLKAELGTGRGLLGFRTVQATDVQAGVKSLTEYRQDWPYVGMPLQSKRIAPDGTTILSQTDYSYACLDPANGSGCTVATGNRYFPHVSQSDETSRDLNNTFISKVRTQNSYDSLGNANQIGVTHLDAGGSATGYAKTTTNTYTNDTSNWLLGRLIRTEVQSTVP